MRRKHQSGARRSAEGFCRGGIGGIPSLRERLAADCQESQYSRSSHLVGGGLRIRPNQAHRYFSAHRQRCRECFQGRLSERAARLRVS
jgi:hypothetical protein